MEKTGSKDQQASPEIREKSESKEKRDHRGPLVNRANPVRTALQEDQAVLVGKVPWEQPAHLDQKAAKDQTVYLVRRDHKDNEGQRVNRDHQAQWEDPVLWVTPVRRETREPGVKKDLGVRPDPTANQELRVNLVPLVQPEAEDQRGRRDRVDLLGCPEKLAIGDQRALPEQPVHRDPPASLDHRVVLVILAQLACKENGAKKVHKEMLVPRVQREILESTDNQDRVERKENREMRERQVPLECEDQRDHRVRRETGEQRARLVSRERLGRLERRVTKGQKVTVERRAIAVSRAKRDYQVERENAEHQVEWVHRDDEEHRDPLDLKDQLVYPVPLDLKGRPDPKDQRVQPEETVKMERQEAMVRGVYPAPVETKDLKDPPVNRVKMVPGDSQDKMEHREIRARLDPLVMLV